jgi:nitrogenase molybdenum-iron protein alpha/beta subunit
MRIVKRVLSTYSADNFGVCSALYELGGLVVMHDASGCNSTYNTHDEPRWYDMDSMVFISGLTEKDAIFGNDEILVRNLCETAEKLQPKFVCICGGPLPHIIGTDFRAVAKAVSRRTGLPCFGIQTNGMDAYTSGAGEAFACLVDLMEKSPCCESGSDEKIKVNLLGATPLDFSLNGSVQAIQELLEDHGFAVRSTWAMGDTLENILSSGDADVNLVISTTGFAAAKRMRERFGIPYVVGCPVGRAAAEKVVSQLGQAAGSKNSVGGSNLADGSTQSHEENDADKFEILLIGEPVMMKSMAETLKANRTVKSDEDSCGKEKKRSVRLISPMRGLPREIAEGTDEIVLEDELREACRMADLVIADPLYARLLPEAPEKFIKLPHVAYSGRFYEKEIPVLVGERLDMWLEEKL